MWLGKTSCTVGFNERESLFISLFYVNQTIQEWEFLMTSWLSSAKGVYITVKNYIKLKQLLKILYFLRLDPWCSYATHLFQNEDLSS